jgi:hypothetical protein
LSLYARSISVILADIPLVVGDWVVVVTGVDASTDAVAGTIEIPLVVSATNIRGTQANGLVPLFAVYHFVRVLYSKNPINFRLNVVTSYS